MAKRGGGGPAACIGLFMAKRRFHKRNKDRWVCQGEGKSCCICKVLLRDGQARMAGDMYLGKWICGGEH